MNRRLFLEQFAKATAGLYCATFLPNAFALAGTPKVKFEIALAQWSLHKRLFSGTMSTLDFPQVCHQEFGLGVVEYVNQFFKDKAQNQSFLNELKQRCSDHDVRSNLIMVDQEGDLASVEEKTSKQAVENHYKWVEAAQHLGCKAIRVNLHGHDYTSESDWVQAAAASLQQLSEFAAQEKIHVLVENHGQLSSKGYLLAEVMEKVHRENCGTLPDLGNFCVARRDGDMWESPCIETYDAYKGVQEMLPYAQGVSAKTFAFDTKGNETNIDYAQIFALLVKHNFKGTIGIEYEGEQLSEADGIKATIQLLKQFQQQ